jgi:cell division protein FtsW (lipid II flippase)
MGGSSILFTSISLGIILGISREMKIEKEEKNG